MTRFPILLRSDFSPAMVLHPLAFRLTEKLSPLSTASITLPSGAAQVPLRSFVRLVSPIGTQAVYRVISSSETAGVETELTLQHSLCTLSDHMHPGEKEETSSCRSLLTQLLSNQTLWALGDVEVPDDEPLTWKGTNINDLQGLTDIMKELPGYYLDFSQSTTPWVLHVRKKPETIACEARMTRNLLEANLVYDTSEMCNVAYADGLEEPMTADTVSTWGSIARSVSADGDLPAEMLEKTVRRYLDAHKNPSITITLTALELSRLTGEPFDRFRLGMLCRCIIDGTEAVQRIETIDWKDPLGAPADVVLTLASTQKDMSATVAGLVVDTRVRFDRMQKKLRLEAEQIEMLAKRIDVCAVDIAVNAVNIGVNAENIGINATNIGINATNIDINADNIALNAKNISLLGDLIQLNADRIELNAKDIVANADRIELNAKEIVANADLIQLNADKIELNAGRIELNATEIAANADLIQLNADKIELNAKDIALNATNITANAENIALNAKNITANAELIELNAEMIELNAQEIDLNAQQITAHAETISLIATDLQVAATNISANADNIDINAQAIQANADLIELNAGNVKLSLDKINDTLTAQAGTIEAKADLILLDGYVKATDLETKVLNVLSYAKISTLSAGSLYADTAALDWLSVNGSTVKTATLKIGEKTATIFAPFDATFDLSDMPGYDDALAAARTEGASSVYVSDIDLYDEQYGKTTKTISASLDVILSTNATSKHSISVDASKAYNAGHSDGYDAGESAGYTAGQKAGAQTLTLSPSTSTTLDYGASQTVTATTSYGSSTVTKTVTLTAPADRYAEGVIFGINAARPTSASVSGTLSGDYDYDMSITCTNGTNSYNFSDSFSAQEAYDKGYEAGKAAMGLVRDGNTISVGESETKSMIYTLHDTHRLSHGGTVNLVPGDRYTGSNAGTFYYNAQIIGTSYVSWD